MAPSGEITARVSRLKAAFNEDGFKVEQVPDGNGATADYCLYDGRIGMSTVHTSATVSGNPKRAYYVEGSAYTMGRLLGMMAEPIVERMTTEFNRNVIFDFFDQEAAGKSGIGEKIEGILLSVAKDMSDAMKADIPQDFHQEIKGLYDGCRDVHKATKVTLEDLWVLNIGVDALLSHIYTEDFFTKLNLHPWNLRVPLMCNAFVAQGAGGAQWFGRDFMFPTAGVFQDTACLVIYAPDSTDGDRPTALVSQTAPGIVGSLVSMNTDGVAMGVNMLPSGSCDPAHPGFNSLLLIRSCIQNSRSAAQVVRSIASARRGVSWIYPVADGTGDAYMVEAGKYVEPGAPFPYFERVPDSYRAHLPDVSYIDQVRQKYGNPAPDRGIVVRGRSFKYPYDFITRWDEGLWKAFNDDIVQRIVWFAGGVLGLLADILKGDFKDVPAAIKGLAGDLTSSVPFSSAYFGATGFINDAPTGHNCPGPFYFAPPRDARTGTLVATNLALTPEIRITSMNDWIAVIGGGSFNDIQWRYDKLSAQLLEALESHPAGLDQGAAWGVINFLTPDPSGPCPYYYTRDDGVDWRNRVVKGSVSLCELSSATLTSLFGYYGDPPLTMRLRNYFGSA
jgi:hypothetical protein